MKLVYILGVLAVIVAQACSSGGSHPASAPGLVRELRSVDDLRSDFNQHVGEPRLVLLLSPT